MINENFMTGLLIDGYKRENRKQLERGWRMALKAAIKSCVYAGSYAGECVDVDVLRELLKKGAPLEVREND